MRAVVELSNLLLLLLLLRGLGHLRVGLLHQKRSYVLKEEAFKASSALA